MGLAKQLINAGLAALSLEAADAALPAISRADVSDYRTVDNRPEDQVPPLSGALLEVALKFPSQTKGPDLQVAGIVALGFVEMPDSIPIQTPIYASDAERQSRLIWAAGSIVPVLAEGGEKFIPVRKRDVAFAELEYLNNNPQVVARAQSSLNSLLGYGVGSGCISVDEAEVIKRAGLLANYHFSGDVDSDMLGIAPIGAATGVLGLLQLANLKNDARRLALPDSSTELLNQTAALCGHAILIERLQFGTALVLAYVDTCGPRPFREEWKPAEFLGGTVNSLLERTRIYFAPKNSAPNPGQSH